MIFVTLVVAACGGAAEVGLPPVEASLPAEPIPSSTLPPPTATVMPAPSPTQAPPTALPTATEILTPPTEEPTPTPGVAFLSVPSVNCCRGRTVKPGQYAFPPWLGIPLAIELGEGWKALNEERAQLFLIGRGENVLKNPSEIVAFMNATSDSATPEELIAAAQRSPELTTLAEPVEVAIAGLPGWQLDSVANPNPAEKGDATADIPPGVQYLPFFTKYFAPGFSWTTSSPEARVRTVALTVGDQTLLLYLEAPPEAFEQFAADADSILQTLRLIDNTEN